MEYSLARPGRFGLWLCGGLAALALAGCAAPKKPTAKAPVVERSARTEPGTRAPAPSDAPVVAPPGAENAGKPGYYTVRPGDTLTRIGLETGQSWRDIAGWNGLSNPHLIEVGQVLRVVPPGVGGTDVPATAASPVAAQPESTGVTTAAVPPVSAQPRPLATPSKPAAPASQSPATPPVDDIRLAWPASGKLLDSFDEARNKGIGIGGKVGEPVLAAADGRVVYAGAGLRGYGNLVILKHNNTYLTAYAHNQTILVREDQTVKQGQKIAEMGSSDADRVKLHFEVRRQGKPVDPLKHLPSR